MIKWPWSNKEQTPEEVAAAERARAERRAAHAALAEALSSVVTDAVDTLNDSLGGRKK